MSRRTIDTSDNAAVTNAILGIFEGERGDFSREVRAAVRQRALKMDQAVLLRWRTNSYYRFWAAESRRLHRQARRATALSVAA